MPASSSCLQASPGQSSFGDRRLKDRPFAVRSKERMFSRLPVLIVDCQTTGTRAESAHVVEIAWARTTAEAVTSAPGPIPLESTLVRLPAGATFPRAAQEISGIDAEALEQAPPADEVWERFRRAASGVAVAVAHYSRFEEAFLRRWAERASTPFPFEPSLVCTHRFAKRLLPGLPSASLRAVAGHLGRDLPELRRAGENVAATAWIWAELVRRFLREEASARSVPYADVAELRAWIDMKPKRPAPPPRAYVTPRETRLALPDAPGVYRFLSQSGRVLYVGKATSLRDRVNSYFRSRKSSRKKLSELMAQVHDLRVTEVATDVEAALLETDEIKTLLPPYNVALRGEKLAPTFCTRDFSDAAGTPGRAYPLGPFASVETFDEVHALVRALETGTGAYALFWGMVDEAIVEAGLSTFLARHRLGDAVAPSELLAVGAARLAIPEEEERETEEDEEVERVWDADEVADSLERRLAGFVRNVRRARWRCRLTDATIAWEVPGKGRRCLEIEAAQVARSSWLDPTAPAPRPREWRRPLVERQKLVVGRTFDRMRVLLTELRRISKDGNARVELGPGRALSGDTLVRALEFCK